MRVYSLQNLEGGTDLILEDGTPTSKEEVTEVNKAAKRTGINYVTAAATEEQHRQHLEDLLFERATTDDEVDAIPNKINQLRAPKQVATPKAGKNKTRMATQAAAPLLGNIIKLSDRDMSELLTPWRNVERTSTSPDYIGYSQKQWEQRSAETNDELQSMIRRGASNDDLEGYLYERGFGELNERSKVASSAREPQFRKMLRNQYYAVPNAAADEELSMKLLAGSGMRPVTAGNSDDLMATDILGQVGDRPVMIDAQTRTTGRRGDVYSPLNLAMMKDAPRFGRLANDRPDDKLKDLIRMFRDKNPNVIPDKLLHYAKNPINEGVGFDSQRNKDYLISSSRPGEYRSGNTRGPYNRVLPEDFAMVDLERARNDLLNQTPRQLLERGISIENYDTGAASLRIPGQLLKEFTNPDVDVAQSVLKQLTEARRRGVRR